jgi:hypothetical protein
MKPFHVRTAVIMACIALTAAPSFAQRGVPFSERGERQNGGRAGGGPGRREGVQRAPERGNQTERREAGRQPEQRDGGDSARRSEPGQRVAPHPRTETERRTSPRDRYDPQIRRGDRDRRDDDGRYEGRPYVAQPYVVQPYIVQPYVSRSYVRPYVRRSYVVPYGYRPYGYRPGWSLNLYFGAPRVYGYRAYSPAPPAYGYYAIPAGLAYGSLRIIDAPRDAQVFVDGYYAGVVDDYDGVFQHLNLEVGSHHIEIEAEGYPLIEFDVRIQPGQSITYRAHY